MAQSFQITLLFLLVCICTAFFRFGFPCSEVERKALLKFKHSLINPSNLLGSWVGKGCCNWKGVGCDPVTGNVIKLDLGEGDQLPSSILKAGEVNPALLELKYLTYLDLSYFDFNGSRFPNIFGSMRQLQYLDLTWVNFSGNVPHSLGNLTNIVTLNLSTNPWGGIEAKNLEWVFRLQKLQYLDLSWVDLSQARESLGLLHHHPSLSGLKLMGCELGSSHTSPPKNSTSYNTLQHLDLRGNYFSGPIPHFLQNLSSNIRYLDLAWNDFNSSIPSWLASKTHLEYLDLSQNQFNHVYEGILNFTSSHCSLKLLDLSNNQLQEDASESQFNFFRCRRYDLEYLYMKNNKISGYLPIIESLSSLQVLDLSNNSLETLPPFLGRLSSLQVLDLSYNYLTSLPPSLGGLSSLEYLDLSNNNLSVVHQVSLANLSSLTSLYISSNSAIIDISPDWMSPFQLKFLSISPCKLNSPFPNWVLSQKNISYLDLYDAGIFGPLPDNIGIAMPYLSTVRLASNQINGSIPRSLCESESLDVIELQKNSLSGTIPDFWENSTIKVVELSSNNISGPIPHSLAKVSTLELLSLNNNSIEGELPLSFSNISQLQFLDVGRNNLQGEIPPWINGSNFPSLKILILRENRFKGTIPSQLCSVYSLQIIDFARNDLSGSIPQCFGHLGMGHFGGMGQCSAYERCPQQAIEEYGNAVEVIKGAEMEYTTILHLLVNIDLSCNNLVGEIPIGITNLTLLLGLNLSHNHLNGTIPKEIGNMTSLESLDLSSNNLSGSIPESISSLDSLSDFNLSFNNLQGPIPTGRHLQTLSDSSRYLGNPGLCGDPLPKKCDMYDVAHPPTRMVVEDDDNKQEKIWFYMVIVLGFATGFWGVIGILVVHKNWRHSYFRIAEDLAYWIHICPCRGFLEQEKEGEDCSDWWCMK